MSATSKRVLLEPETTTELTLAREVEALERERDEALAKLAEARDCGQDAVCKLSPGCQRHWEERNRELVTERDEARAKLAGERAA